MAGLHYNLTAGKVKKYEFQELVIPGACSWLLYFALISGCCSITLLTKGCPSQLHSSLPPPTYTSACCSYVSKNNGNEKQKELRTISSQLAKRVSAVTHHMLRT
jgi:hypothetical protein